VLQIVLRFEMHGAQVERSCQVAALQLTSKKAPHIVQGPLAAASKPLQECPYPGGPITHFKQRQA